jgi:hypothetical protein
MRKPIQIGEYSFKTKTEAIEFYKEILNSYQEGDELNDSDFEMVFNLLKNHPDSERKIGCGIEKIVVENGGYNYNCFHLVRQDSSKKIFHTENVFQENQMIFHYSHKPVGKL